MVGDMAGKKIFKLTIQIDEDQMQDMNDVIAADSAVCIAEIVRFCIDDSIDKLKKRPSLVRVYPTVHVVSNRDMNR